MKFFTSASLFLGVVAATVTVVVGDRPAERKYYILSKASPPDTRPMAITFNGEGKPVTVTLLSDLANQAWTVKNYDAKTQSISPVSAPNLQTAWAKDIIDVRPAGNYVWIINSTTFGDYTIQDGGATVFWGVDSLESGPELPHVTIGKGLGKGDDVDIKQRWELTPSCLLVGETCYGGSATPCCDGTDGSKVQCVRKDAQGPGVCKK